MSMIAENEFEARAFAPTTFFSAMVNRIVAWRRTRRIVRDLAAMEDHILKDIGLSRVDVVQASVAEIGIDRMGMLDRARASRIG